MSVQLGLVSPSGEQLSPDTSERLLRTQILGFGQVRDDGGDRHLTASPAYDIVVDTPVLAQPSHAVQ